MANMLFGFMVGFVVCFIMCSATIDNKYVKIMKINGLDCAEHNGHLYLLAPSHKADLRVDAEADVLSDSPNPLNP